jgi:annexin A7/11
LKFSEPQDFFRDSIKGAGTDETTLIEIICSQSNKGIIGKRFLQIVFRKLSFRNQGRVPKRIRPRFGKGCQRRHRRWFQKVFGCDAPGLLWFSTLSNFWKGTREENKQLDQAAAERDADLLIKAGPKKWGTDEETFSMIFARRSFVQLRAIVLIFEEKTGKLMEKMIESETRKVLEYA